MAIARVHTWVANEVLTASDLNAEFNNILNSATSLISPLTASLNFAGFQATNLRFEVQSSTQSAAAEGVAYWQTAEDCLHISSGSVQLRVPALAAIQHGELVGIISPSGSGNNGATTYSRIQVGSNLTLTGTVLSSSVTVPAASGHSRVMGLVGHTTATTLLASAYAIVARDTNRSAVHHDATGTITIDSATSGLNGRDQAGAFSAGQDLHAYLISDGTTIAGVLADSAPPTGPDLLTLAGFSGYTYWTYLGSYYWNGSSNFIPARLAGAWVDYEAAQSAGTNLASTSENTAVSVSTFVPAAARRWRARIVAEKSANDNTTNLHLRVISGTTHFLWDNTGSGFSGWRLIAEETFPNIAQRLLYHWVADPGSQRDFELHVLGYSVSNGDS